MQIKKPDFGLEAFVEFAMEEGIETDITNSDNLTTIRIRGDSKKRFPNNGSEWPAYWKIATDSKIYAVLSYGRLMGVKVDLFDRWGRSGTHHVRATVFGDCVMRYHLSLEDPRVQISNMLGVSVSFDSRALATIQAATPYYFHQLFNSFDPSSGFLGATYWGNNSNYHFSHFGCDIFEDPCTVDSKHLWLFKEHSDSFEKTPYFFPGALVDFLQAQEYASLTVTKEKETTVLKSQLAIPLIEAQRLSSVLGHETAWLHLPHDEYFSGLLRMTRAPAVE